jgi:lipoprotein-releasing system permease protein
MYHALLTTRYLTTRLIPLIAVAAVAMCVALVIIVVSVMTGFLDMVKNSGRTLMGDVVVSYATTGLPYYDRLIEGIEALPEAAAATPVVDAYGLLKMPYPVGDQKQTEQVQVWGIEAASFGRVTGYLDTLYWRPPTPELLDEMSDHDFRRELLEAQGAEGLGQAYEHGATLRHPEAGDDAIVMGMHVSIGNERQRDGSYRPILGPLGYWWMPWHEVALTLVPIGTQGGLLDPETRVLRIVNEFLSGVFLIDDKRVMIPLRHAQEMLRLDGAVLVDDEGEETGFVDPPRATMVLVRAADGVTPDALRERVADVYNAFHDGLVNDPTVASRVVPPLRGGGVHIQTWRQQQRQFIDPIEKERELMRVLFSIIYLVCAGLVLSIFWAIVYEKTRDIGILRSVGASRIGISFIFLRYGAIIGVVGAIVGLGLAYLVIRNINAIHEAMGDPAPRWSWITTYVLAGIAAAVMIRQIFRGFMLPVVLWGLATIVLTGVSVGLMLHRGTLIWDPSVYYFDRIPSRLDAVTAVTTMIGAVIFSVIGAIIPATRAADTDPVKALRYE